MRSARPYPAGAQAVAACVLAACLYMLTSPPRLRADQAPPDPALAGAEALFKKRLWADAEKALLSYVGRVPPPPDRAGALVKAGVCRQMLRDAPGAFWVVKHEG